MDNIWDGVWTPDLLRDLCGGVTRTAGSFKARKYRRERQRFVFAGPVTVERKDRALYRLDGSTWDEIDAAVDRLNAAFAVPLYETGAEWKVRRPRPEEIAAGCPDCKGTGQAECGDCDGDGQCSCHCGDEHDCRLCDGTGRVTCAACQPARV